MTDTLCTGIHDTKTNTRPVPHYPMNGLTGNRSINLIGYVTTASELKVYAALDYRMYPTGTKVSAADMRQLHHIPEDWHGEWNYRLEPRPRGAGIV